METWATLCFAVRLDDERDLPDFLRVVEQNGWKVDPDDWTEVIEAAGGKLILEDHCSFTGRFVAPAGAFIQTPPWGHCTIGFPLITMQDRLNTLIERLGLADYVVEGPMWYLVTECEPT